LLWKFFREARKALDNRAAVEASAKQCNKLHNYPRPGTIFIYSLGRGALCVLLLNCSTAEFRLAMNAGKKMRAQAGAVKHFVGGKRFLLLAERNY
jgi:hypothetical protein